MKRLEVTFGYGLYFFGDPMQGLNIREFGREWEELNWEMGDFSPFFAIAKTGWYDGICYDQTGHAYCTVGGHYGVVCIEGEEFRESLEFMACNGRIINVFEKMVFTVEDGIFTVCIDDRETYRIDARK